MSRLKPCSEIDVSRTNRREKGREMEIEIAKNGAVNKIHNAGRIYYFRRGAAAVVL